MAMELIMSGNPNLNTIRSVCYFASKYFIEQGRFNKVLFIDSDGSVYDREGKSLEGERNEIVRKYFGTETMIESVYVSQEGLYRKIPEIISDQLLKYKDNEIVVDMTNGNKLISNLLYAAASLSKIKNLFFLSITYAKQKELPENLSTNDYVIPIISPLENVETIGRNTYFEIIYYKDKEQEVLKAFSNCVLERNFLKNMLGQQINSAISYYFLGKYSDTIASVGQIVEEISFELCQRLKKITMGKVKIEGKRDFSGAITTLRTKFCEPLRVENDDKLNIYEEQLKVLQNVDKLIDLVRVYRNVCVHPYEILRGKEEASLVLSVFFYLISLIDESGVFRWSI